MPMRAMILAALAAAVAMLSSTLAAQESWPTRPVTVIVPFGAGGNTDVLARIYAERLGARLGQQFVIENRAGAGGTTGLAAMAKATPDGYTIAVGTGSGIATNPVIMKDKLAYNPDKDFAYLHLIATQPNLLVIHPSVPAKTLPEFVTWLKANPDQAYATSGIGSSQHLCGEMLIQMAGVKLNAVAYRASNQQMQDLIAGQIKIACDNFSTAWEQVKANNVACAGGHLGQALPVLAGRADIRRDLQRLRGAGLVRLDRAGRRAEVDPRQADGGAHGNRPGGRREEAARDAHRRVLRLGGQGFRRVRPQGARGPGPGRREGRDQGAVTRHRTLRRGQPRRV